MSQQDLLNKAKQEKVQTSQKRENWFQHYEVIRELVVIKRFSIRAAVRWLRENSDAINTDEQEGKCYRSAKQWNLKKDKN